METQDHIDFHSPTLHAIHTAARKYIVFCTSLSYGAYVSMLVLYIEFNEQAYQVYDLTSPPSNNMGSYFTLHSCGKLFEQLLSILVYAGFFQAASMKLPYIAGWWGY